MKIAVDIGHNLRVDTGCSGVKQEDKLTKEVGEMLIAKLVKSEKYAVIRTQPQRAVSLKDSLVKRCAIANNNDCDYFISIHFNCHNTQARGTEVLFGGVVAEMLAESILWEMCNLGFKNRGIKDGNHLYVLKNTRMPAVLVECCFCDNEDDMAMLNTEKMAEAIYEGVCNFFASNLHPQR
jgi:N-acetylmuramoyl-L-alanine amidase